MKKRILIIEDDRLLLQLLGKKLSDDGGFTIIESFEGEEGLKKCREEKPDLILLDIIMPGMDGFKVLSILKEDPETSDIPIMILSNLGQKHEVEKGLKMGAVDFLIKANFTPIEIIQKIKGFFESAEKKKK